MVSISLLLVGCFYLLCSCYILHLAVGCQHQDDIPNPSAMGKSKTPTLVLNLKHSSTCGKEVTQLDSLMASAAKDSTRIQRLHARVFQKKNHNTRFAGLSKRGDSTEHALNPIIPSAPSRRHSSGGPSGRLMATLESGVSLGSGEYFMDVFVGTPAKHFSLILDTGSDLNWIQCVPCHDCFEQSGPHYDPGESSSYVNITCRDSRCGLVSPPEPPVECRAENQSCPYYYWYGDRSNTTGDFAMETFTMNMTGSDEGDGDGPSLRHVQNVMFGCGHWNRGLFHGAAGLLGFGRGPLSFASQLQFLYGHSFSYCLVDRNSNSSVSSKLMFGDQRHLTDNPEFNFTGLVTPTAGGSDTFYYVAIKSILVGGDVLEIPNETWGFSSDGGRGTIVDSGTTLSYFPASAFTVIKEAFVRKITGYPAAEDFLSLSPCYNVSGVANLELPSFGILFGDGAVWNFPIENYFIILDPDDVVCLAFLTTPHSNMSIIGNYQQQNFRVLYDTKQSRLGFAPAKCADM